MKKILLSLLALISLQAYSARVDETATFDFTNPSQLNFSPEVTIPSGEGDVLLITDHKIIDGHITISFSMDSSYEGVVLNNNGQYNLKIRNRSVMSIVADGGCTLTSVQFEGYLGDLGNVNTVSKRWEALNTTTTSVQFPNATVATGITKITVKYSRPSTPLSLVSTKPSEGETHIGEFSTMNLLFNNDISNVDASGIKLTGTGISGNQAMTATYSGSTVTLNTSPAVKDYGQYKVTVPAGAITNYEGSVNESEIAINFNVDPIRTTVARPTVSPSEGTYNELPEDYILTFSEDVALPESPLQAKMYKDGALKYNVTLSTVDGDKTQIKLTNSHGIIKPTEKGTDNTGTWTIVVPEGAIHNPFPGDASADRWNAEFTLTYNLESATSTQMKEASDLYALTGVGYPAADSDGRNALKAAIDKGDDATVEELESAIATFKAETNVTMPEAGEGHYYKIYGINKDGKKLYLAYRNNAVTLSLQPNEAYSFLTTKNEDGSYIFATADNKYLHVLTSVNDYDGTSNTNLTTSTGTIRNLTLAKLVVDGEETLGMLSIHGSLGMKNNEPAEAFSTIDFSNNSIATSAGNEVQFSSSLSSGFMFEVGSKPVDESEKVRPDAKLDKSSIDKAGDPLVLTIHYVDKVTIADATKPYFSQNGGQKVEFTGTILSAKQGSSYEFNVNTSGLADGDYYLNLPVGTFNYEKAGKVVEDYQMQVPFTVKAAGSNPEDDKTVTPSIKLSATSIEKSGDALTLTIENVDKAKQVNSTLPYFSKDGVKVDFKETILFAKTGSDVDFTVNTKGLKAGSYQLFIPVGTFTYTKEGKTVNEEVMSASLTIRTEGSGEVTPDPVDPTGLNYTYETQIVLQTITRGDAAIKDVDLNDLVLFAYYNGKDGGIACDPTKRVLIGEAWTKGDLGYGHFEPYLDFAKDYGDVVSEASSAEAIKFVPDKPITAGLLEQNPGQYGYYIPAGTFGDHKFGEYIKNPSGSVKPSDCSVNKDVYSIIFFVHNQRASIEYPSSDVMDKAIWLRNTVGVGYPVPTSTARTELSNKISNGQGNDAEFQAIFKKMYDETNVTLPTSDKYYKVYAQALDGTKVYLTYDGRNAGVSKNAAQATGFQLKSNGDGTYQFITGDGKFLRQLSSEGNTTGSYDGANNAIKLAKLQVKDVDNEKTYGLFSLMAEKKYALVNIKDTKIEAATTELTSFTSDMSCAFMVEELADMSSVPAPTVTYTLDPDGSSELTELNKINITFSVDKVKLADDYQSAIKLRAADSGFKEIPITVAPAEGKSNVWVISSKEIITNKSCLLTIDKGAFTYTFAGVTKEIDKKEATYTIREPLATEAQKAEVKRLLTLTGVGYPAQDNATRTALQVLTGSETQEAYKKAIDAFYAETNVVLPETDKYYKVIAISANGSKAYLTYDGSKFAASSDAQNATGLKLVKGDNNTYRLLTGDGKYAAQLTLDPTTTNTEANVVTLARLIVSNVDNSKTLGKFSLKLGADYAQMDVKNAKIAAATSATTVFTDDNTNGFIFEAIANTAIPVPSMTAKLSPEDGATISTYFTEATIAFEGSQTVELADKAKIALESTEGDVIKPTEVTKNQANQYEIHFIDVTLGKTYTLKVADGAFKYTFAEHDVEVKGVSATYTIINFRPSESQLAEAEDVLGLTGIGYPKADSEARRNLERLIEDQMTTAEQLTAAIDAFYRDRDVTMPAEGSYYYISGVGNDGTEAWLTYEGKELKLTDKQSEAPVFGVYSISSNSVVFKTEDGLYLCQISSDDEGMTETFDGDRNTLQLERFELGNVDAQATLGLFSIKGKLDGIDTYALVNVKKNRILTNSGTELNTFEPVATNAFRLTPVERGDANGDNTVNAADIVEIVNYIMGKPSEFFKKNAADVNNDGVINAADIVELVNKIMGGIKGED